MGFSHLLLNFDHSVDYTSLLKTRLRDQFIQEWSTCINNTSKLDYYKRFKTTFVYEEYIDKIESSKPGEILLTSVDHDGMMQGYDIETIKKINKSCNIPIIASGDAGSAEDIYNVIKETNVKAVAASSIFHFTEITPLNVKNYLCSKGIKVRIN